MRTAALQLQIEWEDPEKNFERLRPRLAQARAGGAEFVILPEMYACGFSMDTARIAEPPDGPSTQFIAEQAAQNELWLCGSVPETQADGLPRNTLVLSSPSGELHRYRKIHPFTFAREDEHYAAGTEFLRVEIGGIRCTFFICYDLRFANEFWVNAEHTDCFIVVANWPAKRRAHWSALLQARAIENQCYVVGVNRVGRGGQLEYSGDSAIIDPTGETLVRAAGSETVLQADILAETVRAARAKFPILPDRRQLGGP